MPAHVQTLHVDTGSGDSPGNGPVLLLLHGLAGTAAVWRPFLEVWSSRGGVPDWIAPDLPGHGRSARSGRYSFGAVAADVGESLHAAGVGERDVVVLGHSLGGAVGLVLSTGLFGVRVRRCYGVGVKLFFSAADLARGRALAAAPEKEFTSRAEAVEFWLRITGLSGLVAASASASLAGPAIVGTGRGTWRVAFDNAVNTLGGVDARALLGHEAAHEAGHEAGHEARVVLARGSGDRLVSDEDIRSLGLAPHVITGAGHNAHVERPACVVDLVAAGFR
jgi:pimeloyl-ACP methyl ester carboxylesterase